MSLIQNRKFLTREWVSINADFENVTKAFIDKDRYEYPSFAEVVKALKLNLIHHITIGRGIQKDKYYDTMMKSLINEAKKIWLWRPSSDLNWTENEISLNFKRKLCGFYLVYTLYGKQTLFNDKEKLFGRVKIPIGAEDLEPVYTFLKQAEMVHFNLYIQIFLIFQALIFMDAFHFSCFSQDYHFTEHFRKARNSANSSVVGALVNMRCTQDALTYSDAVKSLRSLMKGCYLHYNFLLGSVTSSVNPQRLKLSLNHLVGNEHNGLREIKDRLNEFSDFTDKHIMTFQNMASLNGATRTMISEALRRRQRTNRRKNPIHTKQKYTSDSEPSTSRKSNAGDACNEDDGGEEEGESRVSRNRRRKGNLWTYISNEGYGSQYSEEHQAKFKERFLSDDMEKKDDDTVIERNESQLDLANQLPSFSTSTVSCYDLPPVEPYPPTIILANEDETMDQIPNASMNDSVTIAIDAVIQAAYTNQNTASFQ